jgi:hypothetical protein
MKGKTTIVALGLLASMQIAMLGQAQTAPRALELSVTKLVLTIPAENSSWTTSVPDDSKFDYVHALDAGGMKWWVAVQPLPDRQNCTYAKEKWPDEMKMAPAPAPAFVPEPGSSLWFQSARGLVLGCVENAQSAYMITVPRLGRDTTGPLVAAIVTAVLRSQSLELENARLSVKIPAVVAKYNWTATARNGSDEIQALDDEGGRTEFFVRPFPDHNCAYAKETWPGKLRVTPTDRPDFVPEHASSIWFKNEMHVLLGCIENAKATYVITIPLYGRKTAAPLVGAVVEAMSGDTGAISSGTGRE